MTIIEKVAYLKGLADGLGLEKEKSPESKILKVMVEVLEEIGYAIEDLEEADALLSEGLDVVSEDLEDVEELLLSEDLDDDCDCDCDDDCGCGCGCSCGDDFFEVECPNCDEELFIDEDVLEAGQITCPNCGETFALDLVDDDEDDDEDETEDADNK